MRIAISFIGRKIVFSGTETDTRLVLARGRASVRGQERFEGQSRCQKVFSDYERCSFLFYTALFGRHISQTSKKFPSVFEILLSFFLSACEKVFPARPWKFAHALGNSRTQLELSRTLLKKKGHSNSEHKWNFLLVQGRLWEKDINT